MEEMNVLKFINEIEDIVEAASGVPFSGKVMVDQLEILDLIKEIRIHLPDEVKQASYINDQKNKIVVEAQKEADMILKEAEQRVGSLIDRDEITREAQIKAEEIIDRAQKNAKEIRLGALEYADSLLEGTQEGLEEVLKLINQNRSELRGEE